LDVGQLVEIDLAGTRLRGEESPPMEYHIHAEIYRARPDVGAIVHAHPTWSTVLTIGGHRLKPVYAQGTLLGDVPVFLNPLSVNTRPVGAALAAALGQGRGVLMRAHGATIVGASLSEAFALAMYMEENARRQYLAMQIGEVYEFTLEEQAACEKNLFKQRLFDKVWEYQRSKLRR
jgi:L-fuculose-phosphate aldolase